MPKKIKWVPLDSAPHGAYEDSKTRFKHQTLMQDYRELQREVEETQNKLEAVEQRKLILLAEVRYLRRRYKNLVKYKSANPSSGREMEQAQTVGAKCKSNRKNQIYSKQEAILHTISPNFALHRKGRIHIGKEAISRKSVPLFDVDEEKALHTGKDVALLNPAAVSIINHMGRIYSKKEGDLLNPNSVIDLNQNARIYCRNDVATPLNVGPLFDLNQKEKTHCDKEAASQNCAPIFDLNEISVSNKQREDEEFQKGFGPLRFGEPKKCLISGGNDEQLNDVKLPICRNVEEGSTRVRKRKISWQGPMALKV